MTGERPLVFDASSLVATLLDDESPDVSVVFDGHVLDLTFYEAGNVLWKVHALQERITETEHADVVGILVDIREELVVHDLPEIGFDAVSTTATESGLTFYDAAYLECAAQLDAVLVTEDAELRAVDDGHAGACRVRELPF